MNGGRLSDDEAFFLGIRQFREQLTREVKAEAFERPLRMIAVRYPEEAEQIQSLLDETTGSIAPPVRERLEAMLQQIEQQYQEDFAE